MHHLDGPLGIKRANLTASKQKMRLLQLEE